MTFRALVIDALERLLQDAPARKFVLRDASAGYSVERGRRLSRKAINRAIDEIREPVRTK